MGSGTSRRIVPASRFAGHTPWDLEDELAVRIACGQGALAESPELLVPAFESGADYVVCDSLAEATTSLLAEDRRRDESAGFAPDLATRLSVALPYVAERGTRFVTNAGGVNPIAAHQAAVAAARQFAGLRIGLVCADVGPEREVYLGARGIVDALEQGADVVITGRVADAALFLAPAVHEYGWAWDDWDRLAGGSVVGHLLECSNQVAGGNWSGRWWEAFDLIRVGMPFADVDAEGTATIGKAEGTSGRVSFDTVREQLLYEVHDPAGYVTPDVVVDMTTVTIDELGDDRVHVSGATGRTRPPTLKGLEFGRGGWAGEAALTYAWPDAEAKGRHVLRNLRALADERKLPVLEWWEEYFGVNGFGGPTVDAVDADPPEVTARLAWRTADAETAAAVARLVSIVALSGPPGLQGIGRTRKGHPLSELVTLTPFFVDRRDVDVHVYVETVR
jgi:Acyclic terpene utilisation family protein AtuA